MFSFMTSSFSFYMCVLMSAVFLVKFPMFMLHLWLPKAHVEAAVCGSMILAGIMLKLKGVWFNSFISSNTSITSVKKFFWFINFKFNSSFMCLYYLFSSVWYKIFNCLFVCSSYKYGNFSKIYNYSADYKFLFSAEYSAFALWVTGLYMLSKLWPKPLCGWLSTSWRFVRFIFMICVSMFSHFFPMIYFLFRDF